VNTVYFIAILRRFCTICQFLCEN